MTEFDAMVKRTVQGLTCCLTSDGCDNCPYAGAEHESFACQHQLMSEALTLMQSSALLGDMETAEKEADTELYYRKALVALSKSRQLSQRTIGGRLGVGQGTISAWLRGKHPVPPQFYGRIDALLDEEDGYGGL